jgi:hypothetical protein
MINLCRQPELRSKNKSMFPANKSHIASMNLRSTIEQGEVLRTVHQEDAKSRSTHKYKKSLILQ